MSQGDVQAIGQEGNADVGFDAVFEVDEDGADGYPMPQNFEGLFNLGQQRVKAPEQSGVFLKGCCAVNNGLRDGGIAELFCR